LSQSAWATLPDEIGAAEAGALAAAIRPPVALTGATGFVGGHVAEALVRAGVELRVLVRDPARLPDSIRGKVVVVRGDLMDRASLRTAFAGAGTVLHVAGLVRAASARAFDSVNRVATVGVTEIVGTYAPGASLLYVSSLAAAGPSGTPAGIEASVTPRPVSAYGRSKLGGESAVMAAGLPWVIVRPPAVYGPRDTDVLQFFRLAARGIVPLPAGRRWVTVAHVSDVVRGVLAAAGRGERGRVYHLGEPAPMELSTLIATLAREGGVTARIVRVPAPIVRALGLCGDMLQVTGVSGASLTSDKAAELLARHWTARTEQSLRDLGLPGFVPFTAGVRSTWAWYRAHGWVPHAKIRTA